MKKLTQKIKYLIIVFIIQNTCININAQTFLPEIESKMEIPPSNSTNVSTILKDNNIHLRNGTSVFSILVDDPNTSDYLKNYPDIKASIEKAISIWEDRLFSDIPITYNLKLYKDAQFGNDPLASTGWTPVVNFGGPTSSPTYSNFIYPTALASKLRGNNIRANANKPYDIKLSLFKPVLDYASTDASSCPNNLYDITTLVLHEIAHGLGFSNSAYLESNTLKQGSTSNPIYSYIFDRYCARIDYVPNLYQINTTPYVLPYLGPIATCGNVYWMGAQGGNGTNKIYAPSAFYNGLSLSHFDEATFPTGTVGALMTPGLSKGELNHYIDDNVIGVLSDLGWNDGGPNITSGQNDCYITATQITGGSSNYQGTGIRPKNYNESATNNIAIYGKASCNGCNFCSNFSLTDATIEVFHNDGILTIPFSSQNINLMPPNNPSSSPINAKLLSFSTILPDGYEYKRNSQGQIRGKIKLPGGTNSGSSTITIPLTFPITINKAPDKPEFKFKHIESNPTILNTNASLWFRCDSAEFSFYGRGSTLDKIYYKEENATSWNIYISPVGKHTAKLGKFDESKNYKFILESSNISGITYSDTLYKSGCMRGLLNVESTNKVIAVFPNPSTNVITINCEIARIQKIRLWSLNLCTMIKTIETDNPSTSVMINIEDIPNNSYILQAEFEDGSYSTKLIQKTSND